MVLRVNFKYLSMGDLLIAFNKAKVVLVGYQFPGGSRYRLPDRPRI
jgi:hypothetical protein